MLSLLRTEKNAATRDVLALGRSQSGVIWSTKLSKLTSDDAEGLRVYVMPSRATGVLRGTDSARSESTFSWCCCP